VSPVHLAACYGWIGAGFAGVHGTVPRGIHAPRSAPRTTPPGWLASQPASAKIRCCERARTAPAGRDRDPAARDREDARSRRTRRRAYDSEDWPGTTEITRPRRAQRVVDRSGIGLRGVHGRPVTRSPRMRPETQCRRWAAGRARALAGASKAPADLESITDHARVQVLQRRSMRRGCTILDTERLRFHSGRRH